MTALANSRLSYRPLMGGIAISSPQVGAFGTLGCFATSGIADFWGLTAGHVVSSMQPPEPGAVFQADFRIAGTEISEGHIPWRHLPGVDVVAFALARGIRATPQLHELGRWRGMTAPAPGMRLWKIGVTTGITRATVGGVFPDRFELVPEPGMPQGYVAFDGGDSGAAWMTQDQRLLVGIHLSQNPTTGIGLAARLDVCLAPLGLTLLV